MGYFYGIDGEYTPFEQMYLFKELALYQIIQNHKNEKEDGKERKVKGKGGKKGKFVDVVSQCLGDSGAKAVVKFKIKKKRFDEKMVGNIIAVTHAQNMEELMTA